MDAWLPDWADQYGIIGIGVLAVITGISGLLRRESGALSQEERQTPLGRMITPLLSLIWLAVGVMLLYTRILDEPARSETVGYTAVIGSITVLASLILALLYYALPLPNKRAASLEKGVSPSTIPATSISRFQRYDVVLHSQHGQGHVLGCFLSDNIEMVAVRFASQIVSVPATSLTHLSSQ